VRPASRRADRPGERGPVWLPATLAVTAAVAVTIGFLLGAGPAVCHAPAATSVIRL
jgi:hypothetical protein